MININLKVGCFFLQSMQENPSFKQNLTWKL